MMNKIVIFGVGQYCRKRLECFIDEEIIAFVDNNSNLWGEKLNGIEIISPEKLMEINYDAICIVTGHNKSVEIKKQLLEMGILAEKIYDNDITFFSAKEEKRITIRSNGDLVSNKVVFFLPNFYNTGGIRAALYAVSALINLYGCVTVVSTCDGEVRIEFENKGADIIITPDISEKNKVLWNIIACADILFLNGLYFSYLIPYIKIYENKKIIWWLHTGMSFYNTYPIQNNNMDVGQVKVFGVSALVQKAYKKNNSNREIGLLPFGIPENRRASYNNHEKIVFAIIGGVTHVKGIDILLKAINRLSNYEKDKMELWIIGDEIEKKYSDNMHDLTDNLNCIKWLGKRNHEEVMQLYQSIDILVSASREDMLPIVTIEAFQNSVTCIMSDSIGTTCYVEDGINALIFRSEDTKDLSEKMSFFINNPQEIRKMGKRARLVYEQYFSMTAFSKRLRSICEK